MKVAILPSFTKESEEYYSREASQKHNLCGDFRCLPATFDNLVVAFITYYSHIILVCVFVPFQLINYAMTTLLFSDRFGIISLYLLIVHVYTHTKNNNHNNNIK